MHLLEVKTVLKRCHAGMPLFVIYFDSGKLAVTSLHAFKLVDGNAECVPQLQQGDVIWVDTTAFLADGSLTLCRNKRKEKAP